MRNLFITFFLVACGGGEAPKAPEPAPMAEPAPAPEPPPAPTPAAAPVAVGQDDGGEYPEVVVESNGDQMAYLQTEIVVKANTKTRIKMKNNATSQAMKHNVVIVKKGSEDTVGVAGMQAGEAANYVPADPNVVAATALAGPGETKSVVVELPPGEYSFLCTFPGHYMLMKGNVKVE